VLYLKEVRLSEKSEKKQQKKPLVKSRDQAVSNHGRFTCWYREPETRGKIVAKAFDMRTGKKGGWEKGEWQTDRKRDPTRRYAEGVGLKEKMLNNGTSMSEWGDGGETSTQMGRRA